MTFVSENEKKAVKNLTILQEEGAVNFRIKDYIKRVCPKTGKKKSNFTSFKMQILV